MWPPPPSTPPPSPGPRWDQGSVPATAAERRPRRPLRRRTRALIAVVAALAVVLLVVAMIGRKPAPQAAGSNGESTKSPHDIVGDAALAFTSLQSVHVSGSVSVDGSTSIFDVRVSDAGAVGTIDFDGERGDVVAIGHDFYTRPGGAGSWLHHTDADPQVQSLLRLFNLNGLQGFVSTATSEDWTDRGTPTHLDGALVLPITETGAEIDVDLDGRPYPRRLHAAPPDGGVADLRFSDFDVPMPTPTAPPGPVTSV